MSQVSIAAVEAAIKEYFKHYKPNLTADPQKEFQRIRTDITRTVLAKTGFYIAINPKISIGPSVEAEFGAYKVSASANVGLNTLERTIEIGYGAEIYSHNAGFYIDKVLDLLTGDSTKTTGAAFSGPGTTVKISTDDNQLFVDIQFSSLKYKNIQVSGGPEFIITSISDLIDNQLTDPATRLGWIGGIFDPDIPIDAARKARMAEAIKISADQGVKFSLVDFMRIEDYNIQQPTGYFSQESRINPTDQPGYYSVSRRGDGKYVITNAVQSTGPSGLLGLTTTERLVNKYGEELDRKASFVPDGYQDRIYYDLDGNGSFELDAYSANQTQDQVVQKSQEYQKKYLQEFNNHCFVSGTEILLPNGLSRQIEKINVGDEVAAPFPDGSIGKAIVSEIFSRQASEVYRLSDGTICTPEHPFLMETGAYAPIKDIIASSLRAIRIENGETKFVTPELIDVIREERTVYNFTVDVLHAYIANGWAVHNTSLMKYVTDGSTGVKEVVNFEGDVTITATEKDGTALTIVGKSNAENQDTDLEYIERVKGRHRVRSQSNLFREDDHLVIVDTTLVDNNNDGAFDFVSRTTTVGSMQIVVDRPISVSVDGTLTYGPRQSDSVILHGIDVGAVGSLFGSTLGGLVFDDPFASTVASSIFGALGENLFEQVIGNSLGSPAAGDAIGNAFEDFGQDIGSNLAGAAGSYLWAELVNSFGLHGEAAGVANAVGGAAVGAIAQNLFKLAANPHALDALGNPLKWNSGVNPAMLATAVGSFVGTWLASKIIKFDSIEGQIGANLGAGLGAIAVAAAFTADGSVIGAKLGTFFAGPVGALVGAFAGYILGGLIGSLFATKPKAGANLGWNATEGRFGVTGLWTKSHGSAAGVSAVAETVANTLNFVLDATGSTLLNASAVRLGSYQMKGANFSYVATGGLGAGVATFTTRDVSALITQGAAIGLSDLVQQLGGGDIFMKRALARMLNVEKGVVASNYGGATFDSAALAGNIAIAQQYSEYLANKEIIDEVMISKPDTAAAGIWFATIASARDLGVEKRSFTDWIGGWNLFFDEVADNFVDGVSIPPIRMWLTLNALTGERQFAFLDEDGGVVSTFSDTINIDDKTQIVGSEAADVITVSGDTVMSTAGLTIDEIAPPSSSFAIPVAALIDAGDGDDVVRAGDLGNDVLGGAGNDRIVGGKLDDWLFGGDGDDTLFAGDVVAAGVIGQAALLAGGTLVVDAVAASAVDGGNGDLLDGGAGNDRLYGGKGSDWLKGGDGVDLLVGGAGGDILEGGGGDDQGAGGIAAILGGAGSDQYVFGYGDGADVLFDESDPAGVAGSTGDSLHDRLLQLSAGALARNWAGGGNYEVDGSVKGGEDAIVFGVGVTMQNLIMKRSGTTGAPGQDLIIQLTADDPAGTLVNGHVRQVLTGDSLTIKDWFESTRKVEWLRFANGDEIRIGDLTSYIVGVAGQSVIMGTNAADWIVGTDGDDKIYGLNGDDFGFGGLGADLVSGDANNDLVSGGNGDDVVVGGAGNDTVLGDGGGDHLSGGAGSDILAGGKGGDTIVTGAGDDVIRYARGDGQDVLIDDLIDNWDVVWEKDFYVNGYRVGENGTIVRDATDPTTNATVTTVYFDGANWINGADYDYDATTRTLRRHKGAVNGVITAADGGSDTLEFGVGIDIQDLLLRRVGNDLEVTVSDVDATGGFADGGDRIVIKDWWSATTGLEVRPIEKFSFLATGVTLMASYNLVGGVSDGIDAPYRTSGADWITGGGGDDAIAGDAGNDLLSGGAGADTLNGGAGDDILYGGSGDDMLQGGDGADLLFGGTGTDIANYKVGNVAGGNQVVRAYLGAAWANGVAAVGDVYDSIEGLAGGLLADRLGGDAGDNVFYGNGGADMMFGGAGGDTYVYTIGVGAQIREGALQVEEILDVNGALKAGFTATWQYMRYGATTGGTYYQYQLTVRRDAGGEVVYASRDGVDFLFTTLQSSQPSGGSWPYLNGQWTTGATRSGNGLQTTVERIVAGDGGSDTLALDEAGIGLSRLGFVRSGADLDVLIDGTSRVRFVDQATADHAVETVLLADGLSLDMTRLRLAGDAATATEDVMIGADAADILDGLAGDDILSGGAGADQLFGGTGNDNLEGGAGADRLDGGGDSLSAGLAIDPANPAAYGDTVRYSGSSAAVSIDLVTGAASGGDADGDVIVMASGVSTLENVVGSLTGDDVLSGDGRANRLFGLGGADVLDGRGGDDVLVGGIGDDTLYGGDGDDALSGEDGADRLEGGAGKDLLSGGAGADTLLGGTGDDQLTGDDGADLLYGGDGADMIAGGAGADQLFGEAGADQLTGGAGDDQLDGGAGDDTYSVDANSGADWIVDASGANRIAIAGVTADQVWLTRSGDDLRVAVIGGSSVVTVVGYYATTGASQMKAIALQSGSLFLAHAQALISAMTAASATPPATVPAAIAALAAPLWHADGTAAPVVSSQALTIDEDAAPLGGQVAAVDDDDNITAYAVVSAPTLGALQLNATTGAWTYTPTPNANGADTFVIAVTDADAHTVQQTVSLTVRPVADAPILSGPATLALSEAATGGAVVGAFSSTDPDIGDVGVFTLDNDAGGRFAISSSGQLTLKPGASLNYETAASHVIRVRVTDGSGLYTARDFTVTVADVNEAPTGITATGLSIAENKAAGVLVTTLTGVDPDGATADPLTLTLTNDAGGRFKLVGNQLLTTATTLNYEAATSHVVTVLATDRGGLTFSQTFTVTVTNVNEAPTSITSANLAPIAENSAGGLVVANFTSTDPDAGDTRAFSLTNNAGGRFAISAAGVLTVQAGAVLDFETTASHSITIKVTDAGGLSYQKAFAVLLTNVAEAPTISIAPDVLVSENAALGGLTVATFSMADSDKTTPTLQLVADAQNWLEIVPNTGTVRFKAGLTLNFEALAAAGWAVEDSDGDGVHEAVYTAQFRASDGALTSATTNLVIRVEDVNEAPTGLTLTSSGAVVYERDRIDTQDPGAAPAILLGTLVGVDPDQAASGTFAALTYSTADTRFSINGAQLSLNAGAMAELDFETSPTFSVDIVVTDGGSGPLSTDPHLNVTKTLVFNLTDREDFVRGSGADETLNGQSGRDQLFGNGGNDTLNGLAGADDLYGGLGDDILNGGIGDDRLYGDDEAGGAIGADTLNGDDGNDTLKGFGGADLLNGGAGADILQGGDGDDVLVGGLGADQLSGGAGYDTLSYAGSSAGVSVNLATKAASGGDAAGDVIVDAFEKLVGSSLDDVLVGTAGIETIDGGAGADQITGGGGQDLLYGGAGDDTIYGDADNDTLNGDDGSDHLYGGAGADKLYGGAGNDWLYAGGGGDVLDGGTGDDYLDGDVGSDDYVVSATSGNDRIHDFDPDGTDKDTLNFVGVNHNQLWLRREGDDLKIFVLDKNTSVTVEGWFAPQPQGSPANQQIEVLITDPKVTLQANTLLGLMDAKRGNNVAGSAVPTQDEMNNYLKNDTVFASNWAALWQINLAPHLGGISTKTTNEDTTIAIAVQADDDYTSADKLTYEVTAFSDAAMTQVVADGIKSWSVTGLVDAQTLTLTPKANFGGMLYVRLRVLDLTGKATDQTFQLNVTPVADTPTLLPMAAISGTLASGSLALGNIPADLVDKDGSETLEVRISNVDPGLTLNKGTFKGAGVWSLTQAQLTGLALVGPATWSKDLTGTSALTITAYSTEQGNATPAVSASQTLSVTINAAPTDLASSGAISVAETTAESQVANGTVLTTFTRTDADNDTPTYSLIAAGDGKAAGADGRFTIGATDGVLRLANNTLLNYEAAASHVIRVRVTDTGGLTYDENFTVNVANVNERPTTPALVSQPVTILSEGFTNDVLVATLSSSDPDGTSPTLYEVSEPYDWFYISGNQLRLRAELGIDFEWLKAQGNTTWRQLGDLDGDGKQEVTLSIDIAATDGALNSTVRTIKVSFEDVNEAPTDLTADRALSFNENLAVGTGLAWFQRTDPDGDNPTYSLLNDAGGRFTLRSDGLLSVGAAGLNYEAGASQSITVRITDSGGLTYDEAFTVTLANLNEAPTAVWADRALNFNEGYGAGTGLAWILGSDPESNIVSYSLVDSAGGRFALDANGLLKVGANALNFEAGGGTSTIVVRATDAGGLVFDQALTVTVNNVNEAPTALWADRALTFNENLGVGTGLAWFGGADPESNITSYSLVNDAGGRFTLRADGLLLAGATPMDYEAAASHTIVVRATDGGGLTYDQAFTVNVANVNEAPTGVWADRTLSFNEGYGAGTGLAWITGADPESNIVSYSLLNDAGGRFTLQSNGLLLTGATPLDYETGSSQTIVVRATDAGGLVRDQLLTVAVNDVNEAPWVGGWTNPGAMGSISELAGPATYVGTVQFSDPDTAGSANANLQFSLSGTGSEKFSINSSGQIYYQQGSIDYENQPHSYNLTVTARDQGGAGLASSSAIAINVLDVDDRPTMNWVFETHGNAAYRNPGDGIYYWIYQELLLYPTDMNGYATTISFISYNGVAQPTPVLTAYSGYSSLPIYTAWGYSNGGTKLSGTVTLRVSSANGSSDYTFQVGYNGVTRIAPVVLDLDGDGISLVAAANSGVWFDQDGDGARDQTGWAGAGDGILVLDRNRNGQIDDGSEIRFTTDAEGATSDLEGLRAYDSNGNGLFDSQDAQFSAFQVWRDVNQDGVSQADELFSLADLNITAINLAATPNAEADVDLDENRIHATSQFIRADGTTGEVGDVLFAYQGAPEITLVSSTAPTANAPALLPPVVIDLDGDGVELVSRAGSTVAFDVKGDGQAVRTGWVGADDAFLALDRNGDGLITTGAEISFTGDLEGAVSDLEGLQAFDSNANGFLDAEDARFGDFKVWQDKNQDGVSQAGELHGLSDLGVQALNLTRQLTGASLAATGENVLYATSDLIRTDGSRLQVGDVMLAFGDTPAPAAASDNAGLDDGLDDIDRTAASSAKPPTATVDGDAARKSVQRPEEAQAASSANDGHAAALAPRSWSQIDLSGILDAAALAPTDLAAVDYDAVMADAAPSALDTGLALAQQTRLRMIQAMAGFSRDGAADFGPDAWRQGHAHSLALLTALPDVRGR